MDNLQVTPLTQNQKVFWWLFPNVPVAIVVAMKRARVVYVNLAPPNSFNCFTAFLSPVF